MTEFGQFGTLMEANFDDFNENKPLLTEKDSKEAKIIKKDIQLILQRIQREDAKFMIGKAFISFKSVKLKEKFYLAYKDKHFWQKAGKAGQRYLDVIDGQRDTKWKFSMKRAPEPRDILWENLKYSKWQKFWRTVLVDLIILCAVMVIFLYLFNKELNKVRLLTILGSFEID
jgi:hypothetical protein